MKDLFKSYLTFCHLKINLKLNSTTSDLKKCTFCVTLIFIANLDMQILFIITSETMPLNTLQYLMLTVIFTLARIHIYTYVLLLFKAL